jgi:hypothetical protein
MRPWGLSWWTDLPELMARGQRPQDEKDSLWAGQEESAYEEEEKKANVESMGKGEGLSPG